MLVTRQRAMALGFCAAMISATALAEDAPAGGAEPPPVAATTVGDFATSRIRLGFNVVPMPIGTYSTGTGAGKVSGDMKFAFGISPFFDYRLTPNFFVGLGPTYIFNVLAKNANANATASKQLDLLLRVGGEAPVADTVQLYGYLAPGYSTISSSSSNNSASGFVLGVHVGALLAVSPTAFLNGELGYQVGFQTMTIGSASYDVKDNYMQIGLGGGLRL